MIHPLGEEGRDWYVFALIDPNLKWWRRDFTVANFHKEDADAILRIPLSHRHTPDAILWLHNERGVYYVKSGYHVARQSLKKEDWAESSSSPKRS